MASRTEPVLFQSQALLTVAGFALAVAAIGVPIALWPDAPGYLDDDAASASVKAQAVTAGAVLLVAACVCWVGAVVAARVGRLGGTDTPAAG